MQRKISGLKIDETAQRLAEERGLNAQHELEAFMDYCEAHGKKYKNYNAAFRNWLRNAPKYGNGNQPKANVARIQADRKFWRSCEGMGREQIATKLHGMGLTEAEIKEVI